METEPIASHFVLLRHGESLANAEGTYQGQSDSPLTVLGRRQSEALAARWDIEGVSFDLCIASPLSRARHTAEIISSRLDLPIEFDPIWMERDVGSLEGLSREEATRLISQTKPPHPYSPFGQKGEGQWQLYLRGGQAIQTLMERPTGRYLIVSHGGLLTMVLYAILGIAPQSNTSGPRFHFRNTAFATVAHYPEKNQWHVIGINDQCHWENHDYLR